MRFSHFDACREYMVTCPEITLPRINSLGCEVYFGLVSNTSGNTFFSDNTDSAFWSSLWASTLTLKHTSRGIVIIEA